MISCVNDTSLELFSILLICSFYYEFLSSQNASLGPGDVVIEEAYEFHLRSLNYLCIKFSGIILWHL